DTVDETSVKMTVCRSPSLPICTEFNWPLTATGAGSARPFGLRRASHSQNTGQTSWKRQELQADSDGVAMSEARTAEDSAPFQAARSVTAASASASQSVGTSPNSTVSPDAPATMPFLGQKPRLSAMIAA